MLFIQLTYSDIDDDDDEFDAAYALLLIDKDYCTKSRSNCLIRLII
jgi:hypothetical protein